MNYKERKEELDKLNESDLVALFTKWDKKLDVLTESKHDYNDSFVQSFNEAVDEYNLAYHTYLEKYHPEALKSDNLGEEWD